MVEDAKSRQPTDETGPTRTSDSSSPPADSSPPDLNPDQTISGTAFNKLPSRERSSAHLSAFGAGDVLAERFKVVRFVARGGMGEVYEAEDLELNERVALKTVRFEYAEQDKATERFKREIQLARKVTHPNVCRTFDVFRHVEKGSDGETREMLVVSMELLTGQTLSDRIYKGGRLSGQEALPIVAQMAAGLEAAHEAGIVHRDFKSSNVMLVGAEPGSSRVRAVITDFGLAQGAMQTGASLTGSLDMVGTPAYMAPEQLQGGEITPATDIYALGIVMYEMLTGQLPFKGENALSIALKRLTEPPPSPSASAPGLDTRWETTVMRCLQRAPEARFASATEVVRSLRGEEVAPARLVEPSGWKKWRGWAAAAALLVVLGSVWGYREYALRPGSTTALKPSAADGAAAGKKRVSMAILGFQNLSAGTQTAVLGDMLTDSLWSQLDVDQIRFIAPNAVEEMKRNLGIAGSATTLTKDQIAKAGEYLGCDVLVDGTYRVDNSKSPHLVDWNIHLLKAKDNSSMASFQVPGTDNDLVPMVTRAGKLIRSKMGVELNYTEQARLDSSLSANPDALLYFSEAREKRRSFDVLGATKLLEQSVNSDPNFAQAHGALAEAWSDLGYETKAQEAAKKAFGLSSKLSAETKGVVSGRYYEMSRDWTKAMEQYSSLWTLYGDEPEYGLLLANSQTAAGKGAAALITLDQVRKHSPPLGVLAEADLAEGDARESLSDYGGKVKAAESAAARATELKANLILARARIQQCWGLQNMAKLEQAKPLCDEAIRLSSDAGDQMGMARAINAAANVAWTQGQLAEAERLYEQALGISQTIGDRLDEAGALNNIANIRDDQGNTSGAEKAYRDSLNVARERGDKTGMALAQQNLAMIMYYTGDPNGGKALFQDAIKLAKEIGDKKTEARALNNLCMYSLSAGEVQLALKDCQTSLQLRESLEDKGDIARTRSNMGDVFASEGDLPGANKQYEQSHSLFQELGQKSDAAYLQIALSRAALAEKRFSDAKSGAEAAAAELSAEKDADGEAQARIALSEVLVKTGDAGGAAQEIEKAGSVLGSSNDKSLKMRLAIGRARVDVETGKAKEGIAALQGVEKDARKAGLVAVAFQAALARGQAEIKAGKESTGRAILTGLSAEARGKGFNLIADEARQDLGMKPAPAGIFKSFKNN